MINISRLLQQLNNTGLQNKDTPLYQLLKELIRTLNSVNVTASEAISNSNTESITQIIQGSPGLDGLDGQDGISIPGLKGDTGSTGATGLIGSMGFDGADGIDGISIPGAKGDTGSIGLTGSQGIPGIPLGMLFSNDNDDNDLMPYSNVIGPFKKGSVLFYNGKINEDNVNFFWDIANSRLGIKNSVPLTTIDIAGSITMNQPAATLSQAFIIQGSTTGGSYGTITNTGGSFRYGIEGSTVNNLFVNDAIYATVFGTTNATKLQFGTNSTIRVTIDDTDVDIDDNLKYDTASVFSWNTKSRDTVYQALSDGLVVVAVDNTTLAGILTGLTDSSNPPTTQRGVAGSTTAAAASTYSSFTMPVKKGDYYKVVSSSGVPTFTIYWVPLGLNG